MTLLTLLKYLLGNREAILRVAASRQALGLGLVFVLAAGFAREYDGEDLRAEPWHVLIPLAASVASSAVLYLLVRFVAWFHKATEPPIVSGYLDFLGLYWLTAPLALVYAIPFERFLSAPDSVGANLWLLALVAAWRVLLMARVVSVIYAAPYWAALAVVMLFADTIVLVVLRLTPLPLVSFMGGIRLSESENIVVGVSLLTGALAFLTWPVWAIAAVVALFWKGSWRYVPIDRPTTAATWPLWGLAAASLLLWAFVLPVTQPEQQLRRRVERDLRAGRIPQALATMSAHEPGDFPPHWDPPPRLAYGDKRPSIVDVQEQLDVANTGPWVRRVFSEKFRNLIREENEPYIQRWNGLPDQDIDRRLTLMEQLPDRQAFVLEMEGQLLRYSEDESSLPSMLRERIRRLVEDARAKQAAAERIE